jgi:PilZ domain
MALTRRERRRYDHVTLSRPVPGRLGSTKVFVVDVSVNGARIAHQTPFPPDDSTLLRFEWDGQELAFECELVHSSLQPISPDQPDKKIHHTGVFFLEAIGDSASRLRNLITDLVMRAMDEQKSNARGIPPLAPTYYQSGLKEKGYFCFRLVKGVWQKSYTTISQQPLDGFTISAKETEEQITMLCDTYKDSDFQGRQMIRKMSELSINATEAVAARKYHA